MNFKLYRAFFNVRFHSSLAKNLPIVKVLSAEDDDNIKVSFKFLRSSNLNVKALKDDTVENVLLRIKLMANLQRKREEIRQSVLSKHSLNIASQQTTFDTEDEDIDVSLIQDDAFIADKTLNIEAWARATRLKIGDLLYDVKFNLPSVINLSLPEYILSGCCIRPRFRFECATVEDCLFMWYRSQNKDQLSELLNTYGPSNVLIAEDKTWLKIHEGFIYTTCGDDVGCFLKVVCTPVRDRCTGYDFSCESVSVVEKIPQRLPFEERQNYTNTSTGNDSIRCLSYNTLANSYVEKRKFPYCSNKARDSYYRKQLLLKELIGYNSDILCLQEVEERVFNYDIFPVLKKAGLEGCYKKKGGRQYEGLATFYRTSKFKLVDTYEVLFNQVIYEDSCKDFRTKVICSNKDMSVLLKQDSALQILILQLKESPSHQLIVANTHLYSNKYSPEVRLIQAALSTHSIQNLVTTKELGSASVLFCGDFNSLPDSDTFEFLTSGKVQPSWKKNGDSSEELSHSLNLGSACGTPEYTNYTEEFKGCLDYIFHSRDSLVVEQVVPMPRHEHVTFQTGLPNEHFPSDHIALVCTLKWKNTL